MDAVNGQTAAGTSGSLNKGRKVSIPLGIGVALMPYIFAWFLLRKGHSQQARLLGFGWLAIFVAVAYLPHTGGTKPTASTEPTTSQINVDPQADAKAGAVALAKMVVPSALKDPSSAAFGRVWGMSATVACGSVNARNSFGAMAGQTHFIFDNGKVIFENGGAGFARRWNALCIDKPHAPAPSGAGGLRWESRPPASLKPYGSPSGDGLTLYVPKTHPTALEGVPVAEADYSFEHGRLYSADFYIDGEAGRDAILKAYLKKYGTPQSYDEAAGTYTWHWPANRVSVRIAYQESHKRTTVTVSKD